MPSASEAVRRAAEAGLARGREEALRARLGAALRAAAERTRRRLDRQEEEWREVEAADGLREAGELLLAFGHLVPRGAATARLPSFEDPARTVPVALDPSLTPAANAQRLLRRYRKAHRAQAELAARLEAGRAEQARLEALSQAVARARGLAELEAIEAELAARGLFPTRPTGDRAAERRRAGAPPAASGPAPAPLEFAAPGGWRILVGRSAAGNDHLTGRLARPGDIWLHARQMPGSHVLLRPPAEGGAEGTPVEQAILAAARCAAYFSAGRHAASVPVDWTERRHVWKPAGAPPGFFRYTRERTVFVAPGLPQGAPERA
jgi:predicted ribosome quality control (RQC) complex YloA/Tae2 family protein